MQIEISFTATVLKSRFLTLTIIRKSCYLHTFTHTNVKIGGFYGKQRSVAMGFKGLMRLDEVEVEGYSRIANHGLIANNRTAALVSMNGTIDWGCLPNFNSSPVFNSILDRNKGGYFSISPVDRDGVLVHQTYKEYTNILITEFIRNNNTIMRLTDFLPTTEYPTISFPEIHRYVEALSEDVEISLRFRPFLDSGKETPHIDEKEFGYIYNTRNSNIGIVSEFKLKNENGTITGDIKLPKRSSNWVVALYGITHLDRVTDYKSYERMEDTFEYWLKWSGQNTYRGTYQSDVIRSALTLKALFYEPTGLMVAAPTASLPECIGGERNWDYRYAWIRDTSYVIEALAMLGYKREATKFLYDIMEMVSREKRIRTIYTINDLGDTDEYEADLEGYRGSRPVRFGNKASDQLQIDQFGSIINAIYALNEVGGIINSYLWDFVEETLENIGNTWKYPDSSIWEFRTEPRHYVYSKLMCWVAFTRGIDIGRDQGFSGAYKKWQETADEIKKDIIEKGFNSKLNSFTQYYGSSGTDSALLRLPLLGFLPGNDPRVTGTIDRIEKELMADDFLFKRYLEDDGLKGRDNAFLLLSFWYVEDLILMRKLSKAKAVYDSILDRGNHLGLFAEEVDFESRELIGNFPQAITHIGVIRAAKKLTDEVKHLSRNGKTMNHYSL